MERIKAIIRDTNHELIAKGYLVGSVRSTSQFKISNRTHKSFTPGEEVKITIYEPNHGLTVYSGKYANQEGDIVSFSSFQPDGFTERRTDLKIPVHFEVYIIRTRVDENGEKKENKIVVRLRDISAGGICFISEHSFSQHNEYSFIFDRGKEPIILPFIILRKDKNEEDLYVYGCKFSGITPQQEQIVREFVFSRQLDMFS